MATADTAHSQTSLEGGVQDLPAKKKRFGKDPSTGEDKWFAPEPASVLRG